MLTTQWAEATSAILAAERILVVTHISPDGDAIGSALGLANQLRAQGKTVTVAVDGGTPPFLKFLPGAEQIQPELRAGTWDVMISTDASDEIRTGDAGAYGRANSRQVINLDHHTTNTGFGDIMLVDPEAASAAEVVYAWWQTAGFTIIREVAVPLLAGLVTDTLGFRTSSTTPRTLETAQHLMAAGASLPEITARTLETRPYAVVKVWQKVLPSIKLDKGVISAVIRREDLQVDGLDPDEEIGLVGWLRQVDEAMVGVVFTEQEDGTVKLSMRSKRGYDVAQVALMLGGGGHKQASGATVVGSLDAVRDRVMPLLIAAVQQGQLDLA